jgi:asparagine synthase (glutamine-hydrolysing)
MCGITGIINLDKGKKIQPNTLKKMTDIIEYRGPDGDGHWINNEGNVGLGHRRLSIIDLSNHADQPMHYLDRYTIVFNGEIYNYLELKDVLIKLGYTFRTQSDTEVLMALYDRYKENCLQHLDGMFSFVIFDQKQNTAFCARDRFGEKPFFYSYEENEYFYFGSEMKCLWEAGIPKVRNNVMTFNYLAYGFLENPNDLSETFFLGCKRLPHAHFIFIDLNKPNIKPVKYYDINWKSQINHISKAEAVNKFNELFYTSVSRRLRSDVPVGSSLSGGLDSSCVVAAIDELKKGSNLSQNTFSAIFPGFKKDESSYIKRVVEATHVTPHYVTPSDEWIEKDFDKLLFHQEEPFGSASIYLQYCVFRLAKQNNVTVLLDGQGADEVLAGYHPYFIQYFKELKKTDKVLYKKEVLAYELLHKGNSINSSITSGWKNIVKGSLSKQASTLRKYYQKFQQIKEPTFNSEFFNEYNKFSFNQSYNFKSLNQNLYSSTMVKGLQELLRYADRNSMAHSLEVRLPFLNHELVDFIFTLPTDYKMKEGWTKWIQRESFTNKLPKDIAWRVDKIGFEPPQKSWMESSKMKERIQNSKIGLIDQGILHSNLKDKTLRAEEAGINIQSTWRILSLS